MPIWPQLCHPTFYMFVFQAEDGIRDRNVTGLQTCALPICSTLPTAPPLSASTLPTENQAELLPIGRTAIPTALTSSASTSSRCEPSTRDSRGVAAPSPAKQTTGIVVISPAPAGDAFSPFWM